MTVRTPRQAKQRSLSAEEIELWKDVTRDVKRRRKAPQQADVSAPAPAPAEEAAVTAKKSRPAPAQKPAPAVPAPPPAQAEIDHKTRRSIRRGGVEIDARLDLHGLYQQQAHDTLLDFLRAARERGLRLVLVITGKGQNFGQSQASNDHHFQAAVENASGVLRRSVPLWLQEPAFRAMVSGFGPAERQHGGDGALYIRIRRQRRSGKEAGH
ncbi:MAG: DNA mismatch repair protein MutS [Alphaproteobacteria bacterium]|nr:DNA mismatch repair protein MutS [Alphaproteobacteria bacterium]